MSTADIRQNHGNDHLEDKSANFVEPNICECHVRDGARQKEQADQPKGRLTDDCQKKFAANGYHGVSLAALAGEASVSKQALLHFFGTKQYLYSEVHSAFVDRQFAEIEAAKQPDPVMHLKAYFNRLKGSNFLRPEDARLTVRALLDVRENSKVCPVKAYLDRLIEISRGTPVGQHTSETEMRSQVFQLIGAIQYFPFP
ncbi:TetR/AcrR family transcriptional regulator [Ruegeria arenilitoris]|uniref:TetR/AcrR family transcriptional regulator n=1 Tax=Ruegeria arenilitoris TaxID=1173585 RepID=UPI00147F1C39|nr:TetR/AcrR family transcriptional regulator [Ruegeria arenilitoris]